MWMSWGVVWWVGGRLEGEDDEDGDEGGLGVGFCLGCDGVLDCGCGSFWDFGVLWL